MKTTLAMANLRDGGIIVIGASERNQVWDLTGVSKLHLATYDVDSILDKANSYASPIVDLDIVTLTYSNGNTFLVIQVREFTDAPVVCKKNGPEGLVEGGLYIRPPGLARTTRMTSTVQMHELLDLASEKRARRILEQGRRVGLVPVADDRFDRELEGL